MDPVGLSREALPAFLLKRREFLRQVGAGALALPGVAGPFVRLAGANGPGAASQDGITSPDHFVPVDKKLDPKWVAALFEKGAPTIFRGEQRAACAMPVGGIGCGQIYAGGDGTLRTWELFNRQVFSGWGAKNYEFVVPARVIEQGFAIALQEGDGWRVRRLREEDVPDVEMTGQHPVAGFRYPASAGAPAFPIEAKLELFAPFIPTSAPDSTLPVTFFRLTLENRGEARSEGTLLSWLENGVAPDSAGLFRGVRRNTVASEADATILLAEASAPAASGESAPPIVLADFEGDGWGAWKAEGAAIGAGPSRGAEKNQQAVAGFQGRGLVNTFQGDDGLQGKLTSPPFEIARRWVNLLIGGGSFAGETCVDVVVDGKVVASATGKNRETLEWSALDVGSHRGKQATIEIVDRRGGGWGHVNVDQIELSDQPKIGPGGAFEQQPDFGAMAWIAFGEGVRTDAAFLDPPTRTPLFAPRPDRPAAFAGSAFALEPGQSRTFEFALLWHFPNFSKGRWYASRFAAIRDLAAHVVKERTRLIGETLAWRDAYYGGTLPCWLLERLHAPVSNLQTDVTQVWKNGRFWAWEGVGCCEGTCTHVWNYEHATGRLFPELARSTRELQDLGEGFHEDGLVGYRGVDVYAADGQCGTVLKCWREHLMSPDERFLRRGWPRIKKVVQYLLGRDGNDDGLLEDDQHNTYDIQFFGANTFVGSLYLAALRAAEEMARIVGENDFADRCRALFESGSRLTVERLWNGEYFVQQVDLEKHPRDQYAGGCLADQLFGQGWARQVGLGDLYPKEKVEQALRSVWRYCWAPDVGPQNGRHLPERYFARRGEAGLFVCTWPKSRHMGDAGVRYRDEVWTGCEYQVAGHLIWEGLVEEGLSIVRGVHERYDGRVHNPWNEIECGDHYARAMASFGVYLALLGFEYDGPAGRIGFAPRLRQEPFAAAFTAAEGFGLVRQSVAGADFSTSLSIERGRLRLNELDLALPEGWTGCRAEVSIVPIGSAAPRAIPLAHRLVVEGRRASIRLESTIELIGRDRETAELGRASFDVKLSKVG